MTAPSSLSASHSYGSQLANRPAIGPCLQFRLDSYQPPAFLVRRSAIANHSPLSARCVILSSRVPSCLFTRSWLLRDAVASSPSCATDGLAHPCLALVPKSCFSLNRSECASCPYFLSISFDAAVCWQGRHQPLVSQTRLARHNVSAWHRKTFQGKSQSQASHLTSGSLHRCVHFLTGRKYVFSCLSPHAHREASSLVFPPPWGEV